MIVLSFGSERKLFSNNPTSDRIIRLGKSFEQYHMVVFTLRKDAFSKTTYGNMIVYPTNSVSKIMYLWDAFWIMMSIAKKLSLQEKKKTVMTAQDPFESGFVGLLIAKLLRIKFHVQIHTDLFSPFFKNTWMQYVRMMIAPVVIRYADALRCDSRRMMIGIQERSWSHAPIDVLPIYIDTQKYYQDSNSSDQLHTLFPQKRIVFLIASRLEPEKDLNNTVTVFAELIKKYPEKLGLVIVGSGSCEESLKKQVIDSGCQNDILFVPWTNDLPAYYRSADVFMITSLFEGYGLTITESLLCGTPVLATDVGVAPEVLITDTTGWICEPCNKESLRESIENLMLHPEKISQAKNHLSEHPYIHPYAPFEVYQEKYLANLKKVFN